MGKLGISGHLHSTSTVLCQIKPEMWQNLVYRGTEKSTHAPRCPTRSCKVLTVRSVFSQIMGIHSHVCVLKVLPWDLTCIKYIKYAAGWMGWRSICLRVLFDLSLFYFTCFIFILFCCLVCFYFILFVSFLFCLFYFTCLIFSICLLLVFQFYLILFCLFYSYFIFCLIYFVLFHFFLNQTKIFCFIWEN